MKKLFFVLVIMLVNHTFAQKRDAYDLLQKVRDRFEKIEDYVVDATIKVDVNFLKVPESHAKIYFKQPDKIKMDSEGFALLPKQGLNFSPAKLLDNDYTAIHVRVDTVHDQAVEVVKVIPNNDTSNVILSTLFVDPVNNVMRRIESTTKNTGTIEIDLFYKGTENLGLPSEITFSFKVGDVKIPAAISGEFDDEHNTRRGKGPMTGTVTIKYDNYKVNEGIPDSLFANEKDE